METSFTADANIIVPVTRLGGTSGNFAAATTSPQDLAFTLPAGTNYLVAMVSISLGASSVSSMTWKPDSGNAGADQAMSLLGRRDGTGDVEIWGLANPTATVTGSVVRHSLASASKRIMGIHALAGVGAVGPTVGTSVNSTSISVSVMSRAGGRVFDVLYGQNSTGTYTASAGPPVQTERWDTNTTGGLNNLRGCGSEEIGADGSVVMLWATPSTNTSLIGASFNPNLVSGFTADAVIIQPLGFTADAVIFKTNEASLTANAVILRTQAASLTADALLSQTASASLTADAVLLRSQSASFTADAFTFVVGQVSFSADAIILEAQTASLTADAVLLRTQSASFTTNAVIKREQTASFSANSVILRAQSASFTADAVLGHRLTLDAYIAAESEVSFTADAVIFDPNISASDTGSGVDNAVYEADRTTNDSGVGVDTAFSDNAEPADTASGSDLASVVKLGDSLCGPYDGPVTITYDGVDITSCVIYEETRFGTSSGQPGTAIVRVRDKGQDLEFVTGKRLALTTSGLREWTGFVTRVRRGYHFDGLTKPPTETDRYFDLEAVDLNILFEKRVLYDKVTPNNGQLTTFPKGTADDDIILHYITHHLDLSDDGISTAGVQFVGTPETDSEIFGSAGHTWGMFNRQMRLNTGAIDYIDPDGVYQHVDVDTETAPFGVTDHPVVTSFEDDFERTVSPGLGNGSAYDPISGEADSSVNGTYATVTASDLSAWELLVSPDSGTIQFDFYVPDDTGEYFYEVDWNNSQIGADWFAAYLSVSWLSGFNWSVQLGNAFSGPTLDIDLTAEADTWYTARGYYRPDLLQMGLMVWERGTEMPSDWQQTASGFSGQGSPPLANVQLTFGSFSGGLATGIDNLKIWTAQTVLGEGNEHGVRDLEIEADGTQLRNDVMIWGAGQGSQSIQFKRLQDAASIASHGVWQIGQFLRSIWRQSTVDRIADSYVYGSPQNKRGGKDDGLVVTFSTVEQGLRVAQKVSIVSDVYGFSRILPIRRVEIDFPSPDVPRYKVMASEEIDEPWMTYEFWFPPFPDFALPDFTLPDFPVFDPCASEVCLLDTFQRTEASAWGTPDSGIEWSMSGSGAGFHVEPGTGYVLDLDSETGPVTHGQTATNLICVRTVNDIYIRWSANDNFYSTGGLNETLFDDGENFLWPNLNNDPTPVQQYISVHAPQISGLGTNILYITTDGAGTGYLFPTKNGTIYREEPITFAWSSGEQYNIRISFEGPDPITSYRVKIWHSDLGEPSGWMFTSAASSSLSDNEFSINGSRILDTGETVGPVEARIHRIEMIGGPPETDLPLIETFSRTESGSWGTSEVTGEEWSNNANMDVDGSAGVIDGTAAFGGGQGFLAMPMGLPLEITFDLRWDSIPTIITNSRSGFFINDDAATSLGPAFLFFPTTSGAIFGRIYQNNGTGPNQYATSATTYAPGNTIHCRIRAEATTLYAKAWGGDDEPVGWDNTVASTSFSPVYLVAYSVHTTADEGYNVYFDNIDSGIEGTEATTYIPCESEDPPDPDPPVGGTCETGLPMNAPPGFDPDNAYRATSGGFVRGTTRVWVNGYLLRLGVDYSEGDSYYGNYISIAESLGVTDDDVVWICYDAQS